MKPKFRPNADLSMRGEIGKLMIGAQNAPMIDGAREYARAYPPNDRGQARDLD